MGYCWVSFPLLNIMFQIFIIIRNDIPVFFIQDAIKFPDLVHAAKPEPDTEVPQAQSAHNNFWDFQFLHSEATHMFM